MAEFIDLPQNRNNINENGPELAIDNQIPDLPDDLLFDVIQNLEDSEDRIYDRNDLLMQRENNLYVLTTELKAKIMNLKGQRLKVLNISTHKYKKVFSDLLDNVKQKRDRLIKSSDDVNSDIKVKLQLLNRKQKELEAMIDTMKDCNLDVESVLEKTREIFLEYQEAYKKYKLYIENAFQKAGIKLQISNIPRNRQEELGALANIFKERLESYTLIFSSSKEEFAAFENLLINYLTASSQDSEDTFGLFETASRHADLSYSKLHPILYEVLDFDCAMRGFD